MAESITITDNRTGESLEIPIVNGGRRRRRVVEARSRGSGSTTRASCPRRPARAPSPTSTATPGSCATGATRSSSWPSSPPTSRWPTCSSTASCRRRRSSTTWRHEITMHTFIHENVRKRFLEGFHYDAHPMGMLVSAVAALSTFYLDAKEIFDPESRHKQIIRLIAKMPTLAAAAHRFSVGMPFVYPDNSLDFAANFLSMMWKVAEPRFEADPVLARALDILFILHADHEQNCSTTAMRVVGSSHADPYSACAAACAALYGPRHGGANEAVIRMLTEIGSIENVPAFIEAVKAGQRPAAGLRPPGLQELRPAGQDHQADGRRGLRGHRQEPAARHRPQARGDRPLRRVLHLAPALPERRLLLGPHLPGHGVPARDVPGALRHPPHRRAGWPTGRRCSTRTPRSPGPASSTSGPEPSGLRPLGPARVPGASR